MIPVCSNCRWYRLIDSDQGTCHAGLPYIVFDEDEPDTLPVGVWPVVQSGDFCGEHRTPHDAPSLLERLVPAPTRRRIADKVRELVA